MHIIIAGAGMVGSNLARKLLASRHDVVIIDRSKEACDRIYAETGAVAIQGVSTDVNILREAEIRRANVFIAATAQDADNLASAILAKSMGVEQIIVRMVNPAYEDAYKLAGVDALVGVTDLLVNQMIVEVEQPKVREITTIGGGRANVYMVDIPIDGRVAGTTVSEIAGSSDFPAQCAFVAAFDPETEELFIPRGAQVIKGGMELFLASRVEDIKRAVDFLTAEAKT